MRKLNRLTMTLALLITAVGGAWAQSSLSVVELKVPTNWEGDNSYMTVADLTGFKAVTLDEAKAWKGAPKSDAALLLYAFDDENAYYVAFDNGAVLTDSYAPFEKDLVFGNSKTTKFYYTASDTIELKPDADKKVWTLAEMPASDIELQVEYEPTKVTMAVNDNAMGTLEVAGESKVEWTAETWKGWTSDKKELTVDDITMTSSEYGSIYNYTSDYSGGKYKNSLSFLVSKWEDESTVTFSTTGDPFSRIEFTMIDNYSEYNPNIMPNDNWTIEGKSAVWEGEATKSLTLQSCSTYVSKITFFKGAIPDGVTINTDGTFTVAKTATVTLKATPAEGYKFLYWEDDQTNTNPVREVTIESGMADMTYKAVFAEILYNVTFVEGTNLDEWTATPNTEVKKDTKVNIKYTGTKKVIGVKVTKKSDALIVNPVVGQIIGSDGKNYDANATLPDGVTAVAVIAYVGSETGDDTYKNGLAIALADESEKMDWSTAKSTCEGKTAIMGAKWCLPSQDQLKQMFSANGGNEGSYTGLNTAIGNAGGTALVEFDEYWSSSEVDEGNAWLMYLSDGNASWDSYGKYYSRYVRACLAF